MTTRASDEASTGGDAAQTPRSPAEQSPAIEPPTGQARRGSDVSSWETVASLLAPTTVVGALLFYFGWVRTHAFYAYFGIDADELDLSPSDYMLRSAAALWPALVGLTLLAALLLSAHALLTSRLDLTSRRTQRILQISLLGGGALLLVPGAVQLMTARWRDSPLPAACLAAGFISIGYCQRLSFRHAKRPPDCSPKLRPHITVARLLILLIVLSLFWATAVFADTLGTGRAQHLEKSRFDSSPDVILYSARQLHWDAKDVAVSDQGASYTPYRFRYEGLKLLVHGSRRIVLIPYSWSPSNAFALLIPDDDNILVVFAPNF